MTVTMSNTNPENKEASSRADEKSSSGTDEPRRSNNSTWKRWLLLKKRVPPPIPSESQPSPEPNANPFSRIFYTWLDPVMITGYNRLLEVTDIPKLPEKRRANYTNAKISDQFRIRAARGDKNALLGALNYVFFWEFWLGGLCNLTMTFCMTASPFILKYIIRYATDVYLGESTNVSRGVGLAIGLGGIQLLGSICVNQFLYHCMTVGGMARASLISLIYAKSQVISSRAKAEGTKAEGTKADLSEESLGSAGEKSTKKPVVANQTKAGKEKGSSEDQGWSNGRVANLMSTDTYRISEAAAWVHICWTTPFQIAITLVELLINIGPSALAGFGLLVIMSPLMTIAVRVLAKKRAAVNKITDRRISLTQEVLQGVRFVKYFAWEESFLEELRKIRTKEIKGVQFVLGIRSGVIATGISLPVFASILSFITYSLTHSSLNAADIFSSFALFNGLRMPLNMLPMVAAQTIDAYVSLGRIQEYLHAEECPEERPIDKSLESAFQLEKCCFTWETSGIPSSEGPNPAKAHEKSGVKSGAPESEDSSTESKQPFHLDDLSISISRNELIAIVGPVGSGKSSLLAALAGDMRMTSGHIQQGTNMAYCPQSAFIQNATVRENIIFGRPYDASWYDQVVTACALRPDFDMLPQGDQTEVGERGITLSGGQKQRINIARAIYFGADIVLMDDPLNAVDAHVGRHIFEEAICGLLRSKCRVLATHQLHVLSQCDRILWVQNGRIDALGTFNELMTSNPAFAEMMSLTAKEEKKKAPSEKSLIVDDEDADSDHIEMEKLVKERSKAAQPAEQESKGLMTMEEKAQKAISWEIYYAYIKASGSILTAPFVILMLCLAQSSNIMSTFWLSYWTSQKFHLSNGVYIAVYVALGFAQALLMFCFAISLTIAGTESSKKLLHRAMQSTLRAPMSFFDTTPLGRIVNRFSKDVDVLDNFLTDSIRMYFLTLATILSIFVLIIVYYPYFAAVLFPLAGVVYFAAAFYRSSAREIKRHEAVLRSKVFSAFGEGLSGASTIRAYGVQEIARSKLENAIDEMNSAYFLTFASQCWLSFRLDVVGTLLSFTTCLLVVTDTFRVNPSTSAVVLSYVLQVVGMIQFMVKQLAEMENSMNSTERLYHYGNGLPREEPPEASQFQSPPPTWPENGEVKFEAAEMRYRPGLPLVLNGLDLQVRGGERVGVIGRTGAGKSSIMSCIFRLVELSGGRIEIDGLDISKLRLQDLRSRLSIIPQDPTLFRGTVRSNLDPFNQHSDLDLWTVLRQSYLVDSPSLAKDDSSSSSDSQPNEKSSNPDESENTSENQTQRITLETPITEEGLNFSLGQRQLMALARALLRKSRIIICDEATSSIDEHTDRKIQQTMREGFKGSTVLCIAHRLRTILEFDRVVVMDQGKIAEIGTPLELWDAGGIFRSACERSKIGREDIRGLGDTVVNA